MWKTGTKLRRFAVIAAVATLIISAWLYRNREPRYRGIPASAYVVQLIGPTSLPRSSPLDGIREMGPDLAVPALIRVLETEDSALARRYSLFYSKLPPNMRKPFPAPRDWERLQATASYALAQFGAEASPSVPALIRLYKRKPYQVISTLVAIGPSATNAIPTLIPGLYPTNIHCLATASALWRIDPSGNLTAAALDRNPIGSALPKAVRDYGVQQLNSPSRSSDASSRWGTLELLSCFRSEASQMAPVIVMAFHDENERVRAKAVQALAKFGPLVREHAKEIQPLLLDEQRMVRDASTNALIAIESKRP